MNTRNLHVSNKPTIHTNHSARYPFNIRHTIRQSKVVLQDQYRNRYNDLANASYTHKSNNLLSKPATYHRKLMLGQ